VAHIRNDDGHHNNGIGNNCPDNNGYANNSDKLAQHKPALVQRILALQNSYNDVIHRSNGTLNTSPLNNGYANNSDRNFGNIYRYNENVRPMPLRSFPIPRLRKLQVRQSVSSSFLKPPMLFLATSVPSASRRSKAFEMSFIKDA
jgi:hypothetical protein